MIQAKYTWEGDKAAADLKAAVWNGISRAVVFFWQKVQETLNVPARAERKKRLRGPSKGKRRVTYVEGSAPGEPPRKRTGWLQRNTLYDLDPADMSGRVGVAKNAVYGAYLELGTERVQARPWLKVTLEKLLPVLREMVRPILGGKP